MHRIRGEKCAFSSPNPARHGTTRPRTRAEVQTIDTGGFGCYAVVGGCGGAGLTEFEPNFGNVDYKSSAALSVSVSDTAQDVLNVSHVNEPSESHCACT